MRTMRFTLLICAFAGCWQPFTWTSLLGHVVYKIYAMFLGSALCIFLISQLINIILSVDNSNEFTESLYMMLTVFVAGYKQLYMWTDRKNITIMINVLSQKLFAPCELREVTIQRKFERITQTNTLRYLVLVSITIASIVMTSVLTQLANRNLTYNAWIPFNYSSSVVYFPVYVHQLIGMATSGLVNVAYESLICGLLLHICGQLEILEHRLTKLADDAVTIGDCIRHHGLIFKYAYRVNNMFAKIIAIQFIVSMLVVCSNLYRIAMAKDYVTFISLMLYTGCILAQIFIYCWFGNEVKIKSLHLANGIYNVEWLKLNDSCKKDLLMIMKRAMIPIEFSSAYFIKMNLDSFVTVLKTSYSAFNLLHQTQD